MKKMMSKLWEKKNSKKGFTLVELIVVLVILAILMAIMIPAMTGWINKAKDQQNDMTGRAAMLAVQSAGAEKLKTKNAIPEF
ncbi:MAG: prepilin-type N-terminal cleavage/methylation domain-containing protein, partial [Lachnospiraceae bacterium]|nr:prepilin-type N-terminal cleavage/methylation domain-containing protein [Lachnospiraceae bacterium]